jgi:hypothetical protein
MNAHYVVRAADVQRGEHTAKTGGATTREFDYACKLARVASDAEPGRTYEVRYQGYGELARDLLVAAYTDGEPVDIRTDAKLGEET